MTDLAPTTEAPETTSTTLDTGTQPHESGGGQPRTLGTEPEPAKEAPAKVSLRDTIAAEISKPEKPKPDDKPVKEEPAKDDASNSDANKGADAAKDKAQAQDGKPEAEGGEGSGAKEGVNEHETRTNPKENGGAETRQEGHPKPPKSFLPDALEKWTNVPRPVQRDVENMAKVHEQEVSRYKEASERYESIRHYDEVARKHGGSLESTLQRVVQLEDMMAKNPVAALNSILMQAGPRKPDGQPYSLFEVANAIVQKGQQGYQQMVAQPPKQGGNQDEVAQLRQELQRVQQQQAEAQLEATVIAPFKATHPRYEELQDDIALFLKSGKIPTSLSPQDRLEAAYDMAARINPASHGEPDQSRRGLDEPGQVDPVSDSSGTKSIKSAPGAVSRDMEPERGGSIQDVLRAEFKRARRA